MSARPVPAARVRPGMTVLRDRQRWTVTAVATADDHHYIAPGTIDVDAECVDGNVGELAYWTLRADERLAVVPTPDQQGPHA
jgi:hypothetical protein